MIDAADAAIRAEGIEPIRRPIRGGTDGSRLSASGLPTPNIFTGGHEYHSVREWASCRTWRPPRRSSCTSRKCGRVTGMAAEVSGSLASVDGDVMLASEAVIPATTRACCAATERSR